MVAKSKWVKALVWLWAGTLAAWSQTVEVSELIFQPGELSSRDSVLKVDVGESAPDFSLPNLTGELVSLSSFRGKKNVVLSFVPAAWTPVCSAQWPGYEVAEDYFKDTDTIILGITVDNVPTLHAWTTAMGGIGFPVLSDFHPHGEVAETYGVLRSNGVAERALFVIDKKGIIRYIDVHDITERPPLEDLVKTLRSL